jgi:hypothetical protein
VCQRLPVYHLVVLIQMWATLVGCHTIQSKPGTLLLPRLSSTTPQQHSAAVCVSVYVCRWPDLLPGVLHAPDCIIVLSERLQMFRDTEVRAT